MSAFKQKLARLGATAGVLAATTAAVMAVGGASASVASAACNTSKLTGEGSTLQNVAQKEVWGPAYESKCTGLGTPTQVEYLGGGSGAGLKAWSYTTAKQAINTARQYIGTDDGPTAAQITRAKESAELAGLGVTKPVIVPVAQTAIAIAVNMPSGCHFPEETGITNANLVAAFSGQAHTWKAIGAEGTNCEGSTAATGKLTRVVRAEGSGTSFQFKAYLSKIEPNLPCTVSYTNAAGGTSNATTWVGLEPIETSNTAEAPNTVWPTCEGATAPITAAGGGAVAEKVATTVGTIGYAALPDAKAKSATVIEVQNGGTGTSTFAKPGTAEEESGKKGNANCGSAGTRYTVPLGGRVGEAGTEVDWSAVFGGNPTIGSSYPICTLTYNLGWSSYANAGFATGTGANVKAYYESEIASTSLTSKKKWYAALPETAKAENNVEGAAKLAVEKVN